MKITRIIRLLFILFCINSQIVCSQVNDADSIQAYLEKIVAEGNEAILPRSGTTGNCEVLPNRTLRFNLTLDMDVSLADSDQIAAATKPIFIRGMKDQRGKNADFDDFYQKIQEYDVTIVLLIKGVDDKKITEITVLSSDFNEEIGDEEPLDDTLLFGGDRRKLIQMTVDYVRESLPIVNEETQVNVVDIRIVNDETLEYVLKLMYEPDRTIDYKSETLLKVKKNEMIGMLKVNPNVQIFAKYEVPLRFIYLDPQDAPLFEISLTPDEYRATPVAAATDTLPVSKLESIVKNVQGQLPLCFDNYGICAISCKIAGNSTLQYTYKIMNKTLDDIKSSDELIEQWPAQLLDSIRGIAEIQSLVNDEGISLHFIYVDKNGKFIYDQIITPDDLK